MKEQKITISEGFELQKVNDSEYRIVKKENKLPETWEEFCETHPLKPGESWVSTTSKIIEAPLSVEGEERIKGWFNLLPNKEYAEAILALCQLIQLRDCYRQGWKPDWIEYTTKAGIIFFADNLMSDSGAREAKIFSFQSKEIRDKFFKNFKDLIEKTKPLFM